MPIFTIDGNIGSIKNEVLDYLHRNFTLPIDFEPSKTSYYLNDEKNQPNILLDRCWIQPKQDSILIMDRSPYFQTQVFIPIYKEMNKLNKEAVQEILAIYEKNSHIWSPTGYIYLRSNPEKCMERLRDIDNELYSKIDIKYIKQLHTLHEISYYWAATHGYPIVCIDIENKPVSFIANEIVQILYMMGVSNSTGQYTYTNSMSVINTEIHSKTKSHSHSQSQSVAERLRQRTKTAIIKKHELDEISIPKYKILQKPRVGDIQIDEE